MRIVVDTNLFISCVMGKTLAGLIDVIESKKVEVLMSTEGKEELLEVLGREKLQKYFDEKRKN